MNFTAEHLGEIERALRRHQVMLEKLLGDPERDAHDHHIEIAGHLRLLLCDSDLPVLLAYAETRQMRLYVWGPPPPRPVRPGTMVMSWNALVASWDQVDGHRYVIEDYLDAPIGLTVVDDGSGTPNSVSYTPRELIRWAANKDGAAHLDLKKPEKYSAVKRSLVFTSYGAGGSQSIDDFQIRRALFQIGEWAAHSISYVLGEGPAPATGDAVPALRL